MKRVQGENTCDRQRAARGIGRDRAPEQRTGKEEDEERNQKVKRQVAEVISEGIRATYGAIEGEGPRGEPATA